MGTYSKETSSTLKAGAKPWVLIIAAIVAVCLAALCCLMVFAGIVLFQIRTNTTVAPLPQIVPQGSTSPGIPSPPSQPTAVETSPALDPKALPLFGSTSLQRGFSPDPISVDAQAGGTLDTSALNLACGFTTAAPSFTFRLSGGASETFLRIFFTAADGTDTTLVVFTPNQEWKCADNSSFGGLFDPVMDFDFAPSGSYAVWAGTQKSGTHAAGKLYIPQSASTAP